MLSPPCCIYRVRYGIHFLIVRLTFVLFQMSQLRAAKRVCKNPGTEAYYLTKSCNDVARREWLYRDGAARKVLGDRDFVFGDELTRDNLLKIVVTSDELREVSVYKVCVQPLDGSEFTVHVDVAACRISDLKSQIRAKNGMRPAPTATWSRKISALNLLVILYTVGVVFLFYIMAIFLLG